MTLLATIGKSLTRADSWINALTGFGGSRDRTSASHFLLDARLQEMELLALYLGDDMAAKIVDIFPEEMLREGVTLESDDPDLAKNISQIFEDLGAHQFFLNGMIWGRLFGGALGYIGAKDGGDPSAPLRIERVRSVDFLEVYDRRAAWPSEWYSDPKQPNFGKPSVYQLTSLQGAVSYVHESRLIQFPGARTPEREKKTLGYFDYPVLNKCYAPLRQYNSAQKASEIMLSEASLGVFKMQGLISAIAAGEANNIAARATLLDMGKSVARSIMLDAESNEEYARVNIPFAGIPDMLDRATLRLSAASEIPVTVLIGQSPAGMNATGNNDLRIFYDRVQVKRQTQLLPRIKRLLSICLVPFGGKIEDFKVCFPSLWQETPKEHSERVYVIAQADDLYLKDKVVTPQEIRASRFGGPKYSSETHVDPDKPNGDFLEPPVPKPLAGKPPVP